MEESRDEVLVSVQCLAYNHERYIRRTLDGFVMQKTDFRFEVIIHDDASTDGTADIIREYAEKYSFIKPIFQTENQYSKGISILKTYALPAAKGKYYAFCEGDDYWTDENKLQLLADYMEAHPECSMTCHAYELIGAEDEALIGTVRTLDADGVITPAAAIGYENPPQFAAQMFRTEQLRARPELYSNRGVGDYTMLLYAITRGELYYFDRIMARKRCASADSWTARVFNNPEKRLKHWSQMKAFLLEYDAFTRGAYSDAIRHRLQTIELDCCWLRRDYKAIRKHPYYSAMTWKRKLTARLGCVSPAAAEMIIRQHEKH